MTGVTFLDSYSACVSKFLNPGPAPLFFQIWESGSSSDSGFNRKLTMLLFKSDDADSCYCRNWKLTLESGTVFQKFLTPGPDPAPKEKRRILVESTPALRIRGQLLVAAGHLCSALDMKSCLGFSLSRRLKSFLVSKRWRLDLSRRIIQLFAGSIR